MHIVGNNLMKDGEEFMCRFKRYFDSYKHDAIYIPTRI